MITKSEITSIIEMIMREEFFHEVGLGRREIELMRYRWGLDRGKARLHTLKETAAEFDVGMERVRQTEAKVVDKLNSRLICNTNL